MQQFLGFLPATKQVICLRTWCNVCTISTSCVVRKVQELVKKFSILDRYPKANRGTTFFKEASFMRRNWINCLIFFFFFFEDKKT